MYVSLKVYSEKTLRICRVCEVSPMYLQHIPTHTHTYTNTDAHTRTHPGKHVFTLNISKHNTAQMETVLPFSTS